MIPPFLLLAAQLIMPDPADPGLRPPVAAELSAAEARERRRLPVVVQLCREGVRSGDVEARVRRFADRNGLSSYGRLTLLTNCRLYRQGVQDGLRPGETPARRPVAR